MNAIITSSTAAEIESDPRRLIDDMRAGRIIKLPDLGYTIAPTGPTAPTLQSEWWDEDADMVSQRKKDTGIGNTIFISTRGNAQHAARIKVAIDPPDSLNAASTNASVAIHDYSIMGRPMSPTLARQVQAYIDLNRAVLLDYWDEKIDTSELLARLRPILPGVR
jgi:hypothetical protein